MDALRRTSTALVGMLLACAVITAPSLSYADRDGKKHRKHHRQASHRDRDWYRDHWGDNDRHDRRHSHRHYDRGPRFSIGVQYGSPGCGVAYRPVYVPVRTYCPPPRPVVYVPVQYDDGYYYDRECERRFSNLELYFEHVSAGGSASVHIRN